MAQLPFIFRPQKVFECGDINPAKSYVSNLLHSVLADRAQVDREGHNQQQDGQAIYVKQCYGMHDAQHSDN